MQCLKFNKAELKLIQVPEMFILFEKFMRAGVSYFSNKYGKAINKYIKSYDPK